MVLILPTSLCMRLSFFRELPWQNEADELRISLSFSRGKKTVDIALQDNAVYSKERKQDFLLSAYDVYKETNRELADA